MPPGVTVVGIPGRVVEDRHEPLVDLEHGKLPDPVAEAIRLVLNEQDKLEERLAKLERLGGIAAPKDELKEKKQEFRREFSNGEGI